MFRTLRSIGTRPESDFDQPSENRAWLLQVLYEKDDFLAELAGNPGGPSGKADNPR